MVASVGMNQEAAALQKRIERFQMVREQILMQVREVIVGQQEVLDQILIAIFVGGHCLMTGLPGTAKTLMVHTIAETLGLKFRRIQFTPDLMPSDITGTDIIEEDLTTGHRKWTFVEGPIFGNILLADEINRTPPKTQAALLEAMQEHSCTVRGHIYRLPAPFFVLAAKARALSRRRYHVTYDDITSVTLPVLRHRILLNFHAESERIDADEILNRLLAQVPRPKES